MTDTSENMPTKKLSDLGPYVIESTLGQGGMGIVYRAIDMNLGREVAIKVLHPHLLRHENLKQRFRREARMHAKLMHPNIVTLLSLFEDSHHMALVMELVQGHDLKVHLRKNPSLPLKEKLRIASGILAGLEASHQYGMVHRDLKPANILISEQGEVKLLDFGLAKPEQGNDDLTQSGATVGSFRYMSPEQILNNPIDARTDLYAFGILLFLMTVGRLPFDTSSHGGEFEIMEKQVREPAPAPHDLNAGIPLSLSKLIQKLLAKNKHERPESAAAVRREIKRIQEEIRTHDHTPAAETTPHILHVQPDISAPSNHEIAQQWIQHVREQQQLFWTAIQPTAKVLIKGLRGKLTGLSGIASVFVLLGILVTIVLNMAEENAKQSSQIPTTIAPTKKIVTPETAKTVLAAKEAAPVAVKPKPEVKPEPVVAPEAKPAPVVKPVEKPAPVVNPKPVVKPKPKVRKKDPSITYSVNHKVTRSDGTVVDSNKKHEFRSGSHLFYPELAKKDGWFGGSEKGESVLTFEKPTAISTIVLHMASVGKADFTKGYIYLEIKAPDSSDWVVVFEQEDKDLDSRKTFKDIGKKMKLVESVRIGFKTYDPITIGPIDLLP